MKKYRVKPCCYVPFVACMIPLKFMVQKRRLWWWEDIKTFDTRSEANQYIKNIK